MKTPPPPREFRRADVGASLALGVVVLASAVLALKSAVAAEPPRPTEAPPLTEHAVRVLPVVDTDAPLLKLGGSGPAARPPPHRAPQTVAKARAEERAVVSSKASKEPEDVPAPEVKMAAPDAKPPPPKAELAKTVDTPVAPTEPPPPAPSPAITAPVDAGAPSTVAGPGQADGVKEGAEADPLKARAVDLYRAKIAAWFSSRFRVTGSGLSQEELTKYRVSATITVGDDRTVSDFAVKRSGNAAFDAAADRALEAARGKSLPPPPENYPDVAQARISVTFVCRENRCD